MNQNFQVNKASYNSTVVFDVPETLKEYGEWVYSSNEVTDTSGSSYAYGCVESIESIEPKMDREQVNYGHFFNGDKKQEPYAIGAQTRLVKPETLRPSMQVSPYRGAFENAVSQHPPGQPVVPIKPNQINNNYNHNVQNIPQHFSKVCSCFSFNFVL